MCVWKVMADVFDFDDSEIMSLLYKNYSVEKFLESKHSMGISACKGMGKTFLLKAKRMQMTDTTTIAQNILLLPKNQLLDTPATYILNKTHRKFLESYYNWVDLWVGCISIFLISQEEVKAEFSSADFADLNKTVKDLLSLSNNGVYHVLSRVLSENSQQKLRDVTQAGGLLFALVQRIHRPICLFVDKLEEPFNRSFYRISGRTDAADGKYNASIWAYAQVSFAEAVYRLYAGRHHIKIYFGIRQEALTGIEHITEETTKLTRQMITKLEYSYEDLYKMFQQYIQIERPQNLLYPDLAYTEPVKALCGVSSIKHRSGAFEQMWAYIYRHTLQRPRDIMEMGQTLYQNIARAPNDLKNDCDSLVRKCRHWVNEISTRECMDYITGLEPFMAKEDNITFTQEILTFLQQLPTNVFTDNSVLAYCHESNNRNTKIDCTSCCDSHFFSTLYNIGLLGYIYESQSESGYKNFIKQIGDSVFSTSKQTLPTAIMYYAHPGLGNVIKTQRESVQRLYTASNFVINSSEVFANVNEIKMLQHFCASLLGNGNNRRVFLTSTGRDLGDVRKRIKKDLENAGYEVYGYEFENFPQMPSNGRPFEIYSNGETHDHCIDVMLSCKHLIYIYGGRFGGKYHGGDYAQYAIECSDIIKIRPSISFMEYLVAKKFGKNTKVYVHESVDLLRGEWLKNGSPETYCSEIIDDIRVFKQLGYFNALGNGTWYDKFSDSITLEKFINTHFLSQLSEI